MAEQQLAWEGIHAAFKADWKTAEILLEGSLGCGKTTVALDKEIDALLKWPGIPILLFRWTEDAVTTKLKPAFEELLAIRGLTAEWDAKQKAYQFSNGSTAFMFGLKAVSEIEQFNKIRGLGVSRIMGDQVEEMKRSVAGELRGRLRPDLTATMRGVKFPFQLTFVANPEDEDFWLSKEFPLDNRIKGRKVYSLSVFDNPHLPKETIEGLVRAYPEDHPKHQTMVMGRRGPNVVGDAVFEGVYRKDLHWRSIALRPDEPLLESYEFGTHNPTWVCGQALPGGGFAVYGGIRGEGLVLDDFLSIVETHRTVWLPPSMSIKTCIAPMGRGLRYTPINILRQRTGLLPLWRDNGNAPDTRLAMIEQIAAALRRRNASGQESFAVNNDDDRFLIVNRDGVRPSPFVHHAFEGGFVWDPHFVSTSNKELKQSLEDDKFANAMHCIENIMLNFIVDQPEEEPEEGDDFDHSYRPASPWG